MSPTIRVHIDPESLAAAEREAAGWIELADEGQVTPDEAGEMIREIAKAVKVDVEFRP